MGYVDRLSRAVREREEASMRVSDLEVFRLEGPPVVFRAKEILATGKGAACRLLRDRCGERARYELIKELRETWKGWNLKGAFFLFDWRGDALPEETPDGLTVYADSGPYLKAIDPILVLNVLARARGRILTPGTPMVLRGEHLKRELASTDPRLRALAQRTGAIEEVLG